MLLKHRLSLVGTVAFDLALTAAAAFAADDHLRENVPVMVVETVFPGGSDPKAAVSTRLGIRIIQAAAGAGRTMLISDSGNVYSCGKDSFGEAEYGGQGSNVLLSSSYVRITHSIFKERQEWLEKGVPHLRGSFPWARLGSGPLHPGGLYLGWGQGPTPSTAFDDRMGSSPPLGVEPVSMTIGPQGPYQVSYHIPGKEKNPTLELRIYVTDVSHVNVGFFSLPLCSSK
ncbi:hypothetical protein HID58_029305 [Brassica napus]|uniref:Uncharacterized protein n=1 Tax=Brassica napus TaxID=3708 RepID=A0ABQ8CCR1_BRANA|nr:hypothetical protein HID58_029305 [Brassica napus]